MSDAERTTTAAGTELQFPGEGWRAFFRDHFGPSVLWALLSIGSSHFILAPTIGARYGLFGLWLFALIYALKWGGWELGVRYTYGTGRNPVEAYGNLPGPDRWAQWFTLGIYLFLWTNILGAIAGGAAAFTDAFVDTAVGVSLGLLPWYVILIVPTAGLVLFSNYQWIERLIKLCVVVLAAFILFGVGISPPDAGTASETLTAVPDVTSPVFIALFAAAAAYTPIGLSSSVSIGSWSVAKKQGARELREKGLDPDDAAYHDYIGAWMRTGLRDFNLAYLLSFGLVASMVVLATSTLYGTGNIPSGEDVPIAVGQLLEDAYGGWAFYVMMVGALVALFSTVIGQVDAISRVCADILGLLRDTDETEPWRKQVVVFVTIASVLPVLAIGNYPVVLITFSAALVGVFQVFFYLANYYAVKTELPAAFHPSRRRTAYYVVGILLVALFGLLGALNNFGLVAQ